ncbi:treslin isoform X1 [Cricetulus griseus]|uniref:Treslin isoform X2 n=2 Tax=Cricetulus griseus TaxID=10029 RepID=A0A9J7FMZ2_CRIGR|nr:treslin isoform X1 [Cricetulus griseus]XP_027264000.1 treslin isoform X2 [Cricetulus griseus]
MACCHKVVLLVDTAVDAARHSPARRAALRLLTYLSGRFGLPRVHWAFKFFDSQGARSRPSRVSDFRELGSRSWEDFEQELETRLGDRAPGAHLPGPTPRATHTHGALMETLLDYQWDRPEITSPTKPILRSSGRRLLDADSEAKEALAALGGFGNAVFLLAPCPHSQRELLQFVSGCEAQTQVPLTPKQVMEKVLPKRVQEVMIARNITLYWVDTTERSKLWASPDHIGYWTVCELLHHGGGTILPSETWSLGFTKVGETVLQSGDELSRDPHLSSWISALPIDATVNCLLYNSPEYEASFPQTEGTLFLPVKGKEIQETWAISLEPLAMHQRHFQKPVRIFLRGSVAQWSLPMSSALGTDNWMLQSPEGYKSTQRLLFQELVSRLTAEEFHLVASVDPGEGWPPITGIISPFSANAMILTVFRAKEAEFQRHFLQTAVTEGPQDITSLFSDVVDSVLTQVPNLFEDPASSAPCVPEWVQQELSRTSPWSPALMEKWFPFSNVSGATSDLMESFWLLHAASPDNEESSKTESELTRCLSELYQRKSHEESTVINQDRSRKKRGIPRTPVRQKMNTMSRSLKMLNVARLNVKAQKLHPDGSPDMAVEKGLQKTVIGRTGDKSEDRGRTLRSSKLKDFKTEEELLSYIHENYQKTVSTGEITLYSCAQNMVSTIKVFLKSKDVKELEVTCLNHMNSNLLKTSKTLRQNIGGKLDKEDKVRECQLQVFLRLEMCQQCPSILESTDEVEQVVEEVTDLLRMVCLTKDSAYLSEFLEEILRLYIDSIPGTIGQLYHSLGLKIPQKLAGVLPTEFFSDDSMTQESKSPPPSSSAHRSVSGITESEQLEELRTRSAKKRRKNALIRHKSIAEISQTLRQIEVPKVSKRAMRNNSQPASAQPLLPRKDTVQEVTKVRRNLFNQEMISPSKRGLKRGLPRSHSVSALDCPHNKQNNFKKTKSSTFQGYHKLLTKSVAETPVHKQISRRLLHRQIKGRSSDPGPDIHVVEESPVKEDEISLRRSPRIKQLLFNRTNSGSFYSVSQPKSRSVQRLHSFQQKSDQRENFPVQSNQSPKTLLFGALSEIPGSSKKGSARIRKSSRSILDSEISTAYQTPKKSNQKSPNFPKTTPRRRFPRMVQTSLCTPERLQNSPTKITPAEGGISEAFSSHSYSSPLASKVTPQKRVSPTEQTSPLLTELPSTPRGPDVQLPRCLSDCAWLNSVNSSPESPYCPPSPPCLTAESQSQCLSPARYFRTPPRTALAGTPEHQKPGQLSLSRASQAQEPAQELQEKAVKIPKQPTDPITSSQPLSPKEHFTSGCDGSQHQPRKSSAFPPPGELSWKSHPTSPSTATPVSYLVPSTPPRTPRRMTSHPIPPSPPSKLRRLWRKTSSPQDFPECQPGPSAAPVLEAATSPGAITGSKGQQSCEGQSAGFRNDWQVSSPVLIARDTEHLPLIGEAQLHSLESHEVKNAILPEGEAPKTTVADEPPSVSGPGILPPVPSYVSSSPELLPYGMADGRQSKTAAQQGSPQASEATGSPQTYEVEMEMQSSGLPKLRIKKIDPGALPEVEALGNDSPLGEECTLPALNMPKANKSSSRAEHTYLSPPCLLPSHSTPGKSGGQTFICQSCTPSRCPPSTPSPFQADVGVSWTPSPKQSGKTTPEIIKDWPRRKRAVDCSAGPFAGRGEANADFPGASSLLEPEPEPEGKEQNLEHHLSKVLVLEDFELEGVCQLPDQSPPKDSVSKAEEAFSWGQFELGSRKRYLSAKEEAEYDVKRVCDSLSEDPQASKRGEWSPHWRTPPLRSVGEDEVFVSGSTPPSGCMVRSCLSASGLQALTQSPLLFQGRTPSSHSKDTRDEEVDVFPSTTEESPFSQAFSRRRAFRTYTRKKLIS